MPSSTRRYRTTTDPALVVERGNQRLVIHRGNPPSGHAASKHWLVFAGLGSVGTLLLIACVMGVWQAAENWQVDQKYGYPRTYQTDAVVGHNDSADRPSHFTIENLNGQIIIYEVKGGNPKSVTVYAGPTLSGDNPDRIPVSIEFHDETGGHTIDMVLIVNGKQGAVYLNDGTQFKQAGGG